MLEAEEQSEVLNFILPVEFWGSTALYLNSNSNHWNKNL